MGVKASAFSIANAVDLINANMGVMANCAFNLFTF